MLLQQSGVAVSAEELVPQVYLPARKGSLQVEMLASGRRYQRIPYVIDPSVQALTSELHAGRPVLVLQNLGLQARPLWHYAVVIGYTQENDHIILRSGTQERQPMPAWLFLKTWETAGHWGIVLLQPGKLPAHPDRDRYLKAVATAEGQIEPRSLLNAYEAALTHWPDDPIAQFGRANALHALGRLQDAGKAYRQIVASDASNIAALNNLAEVYADLGCHQLAEETISEAFASADENAPLRPVLMDTRRRIHQDFHAASASECSATH